ncbi:MAG TPA: hypothetical protein VFF75_06625 [Methylophilaceae bacterium]|nr:hypothetical protein [Methylophilaceae bacterium]
MRYLLIAFTLLSNVAFAAEPFGRLFTTPSERATLDHLRQTRKIEPVNIDQPQEVIEVAPVAPPQVSVQGYVKRSDGKKGTVWINEKPVQENSSTGGVEVGKLPTEGNQIQIKVPGLERSLKLKAGQAYDPQTDSITENKVRPGRSEAEVSGTIGTIPGDQP